ncbi:hypothetical protein HELRODRAFT_185989 [Helobdella robusta]|uniref:Uncharacterized protein n=1 Tax=Helobdella robusta TaxID=6412 RepID=T1FNI9_HELRO|nr:hypothetical protein HELRODRAFT_185989 [Helobdella robusta]ESN95198.1 hypothetical protein HELRODRAFT_185989 [Helobdella robusta]
MAESNIGSEVVSAETRQKIVEQFKLHISGATAVELENSIYARSSNHKDYMADVHASYKKLEAMKQLRPLQQQQGGTSTMSVPQNFVDPALHQQSLSDPINALQHLTKQGQSPLQSNQMVRPPGQVPAVLQPRYPTHPGAVPGGLGVRIVGQQVLKGDVLMGQQQQNRMPAVVQANQMMASDQFQGGIPGQFQSHMQSRMQQFNQQVAGSPGGGQAQQHLLPSPGSSMTVPSPSNLNAVNPSPSMQQQMMIGLSPSSRMSLPSPGSHLNTPASEEQEYLQKWEQLQKYLEPLKKMILKIDKDEDRKMDMNKMKNLLDILSDRSKRLPLSTLLKCESVLERQLNVPSSPSAAGHSGSAGGSSSSAEEPLAMGQELYDVLKANIKRPDFHDVLKKTFEGAVRLIPMPEHIEYKRTKSKLPKYSPAVRPLRKTAESYTSSDLILQRNVLGNDEINESIQNEVLYLDDRYLIQLDTMHITGSESILLSCTFDDLNLPKVPSLIIQVPSTYPNSFNPQVLYLENNLETSPFFDRLRANMLREVGRLGKKHSLTELLVLWERVIKMSITTNTSLEVTSEYPHLPESSISD